MSRKNTKTPTFSKELANLINKHSLENESNTPDYILADYLCDCLESWNRNVNKREDSHLCDEPVASCSMC